MIWLSVDWYNIITETCSFDTIKEYNKLYCASSSITLLIFVLIFPIFTLNIHLLRFLPGICAYQYALFLLFIRLSITQSPIRSVMEKLQIKSIFRWKPVRHTSLIKQFANQFGQIETNSTTHLYSCCWIFRLT